MTYERGFEPCSSCFETFERGELARRCGRCPTCLHERRPRVTSDIIATYTDLRRGGMSTPDACARIRAILVLREADAAE